MDFGFLQNPIIKNFALGKLKKGMQDDGITLITVSLKPDGEFEFLSYDQPVKVMPIKDIDELTKLATS